MTIDNNKLSRREMIELGLITIPLAGSAQRLFAMGNKITEVDMTMQKNTKTGLVYDDIYLEHDTGPGFPERPERLNAIIAQLKKTKLIEQLTHLPLAPTIDQWIQTIHSADYIERVEEACLQEQGYIDTMDVPVCAKSYEVAKAAVRGVISAADWVVEQNVRNAFCAVRPPGHHALKDMAMGFCFFNNIAITARYIQQKHKLPKILIVDWDVHHGNGTQQAFYDDPTVLYFSIHQYPFYPGSGGEDEKGTGAGLGYTINVPRPPATGDEPYIHVFEKTLKPAALDFEPDFVLISAGFDAHKNDSLGAMNVTARGFGELTKIVKDIAESTCNGRIVSMLEGGYELKGLADSVEAHIKVLMDNP